MIRFFASVLRWFLSLFAWLFRKAKKPFRPSFEKPGDWAKFVKSFHFDQLPSHRKPATFRQIMSFRS